MYDGWDRELFASCFAPVKGMSGALPPPATEEQAFGLWENRLTVASGSLFIDAAYA